MPPKKKTDEQIIAVGTAIEVLNQVKYGGKSREPAAGMMPAEFGPSDDPHKSPLDIAKDATRPLWDRSYDWSSRGSKEVVDDPENVALGTAKVLAKEGADTFLDAWRTFIFGGNSGVIGGKRGQHNPGLLGVYDVGRRLVEKTGVPQLLHEEQMDLGLLEEDSLSRALFTDPFLLYGTGKALAGTPEVQAARRYVALSPSVEKSRNALRWAVSADPEAGKAINLSPVIYGRYKAARDGARAKWTEMYDAIEDTIWNKMRGDKHFKGEIRDYLSKMFQTNRAKYGDTIVDGLNDIYSAREVARLNAMPVVRQIRSNVPVESYKDLSRYVRPRVVGGERVWPAELGDETKAMVDEMLPRRQALSAELVDLKMMSRNVDAEYAGHWYPRQFSDRKFMSEKTQKIGPAKEMHMARDAYFVRAKMTKEEARTLMKGTGGEASSAEMSLEEFRKTYRGAYRPGIMTEDGEWVIGHDHGHAYERALDAGLNVGPEDAIGKTRGWSIKRGGVREIVYDADMGLGEQIPEIYKALVKRNSPLARTPSAPGSAVKGTDLTKGRAKLDEIYSGQKGDVALVKFSPKEYGSEEAAEAAAKEFTKRARNVKYKVLEEGKPLTELEMAEYGELTDPATNIFNAQAELEIRAAKGRFFRTVSQDTELALTPTEAAQLGKKWKAIPETTRWGELSGMHVRPDIFRDITEFDSTLLGPGKQIWRHVLRNFKASKTIWSPSTTVRNFFGNVPFSVLADATAPWAGGLHNYKHYREGFQALLKKEGPLYEEMVRKGVIGTQYGDAELKVLEPLFRGMEAPGAIGMGKRVVDILHRFPYMKNSVLTQGAAAEKVAGLYNFMDTVYRAGIYTKARRAWKWSDSLSAAHVNEFTPNYVEVGEAVKILRESPIGGPFASFGAESVRILRNGIRKRPLKSALVTAGAPWIYSRVHKGLTGMTDSEYEAIRQDGPMTIAYPTKDDEGNLRHFPLDFWSPWGWMQTAFMGNKYTRREAREAGLTGLEENVHRFAELSGPFFGASPAFTTAAGVFSGKDLFTKRQIQQEGERYFPAYGKWLLRQALPEIVPGIGRKYQMVEDLARGRTGYRGTEMDTGDTLLNAFIGIQRRPYDTNIEKQRWSGQMRWSEGEMKRAIDRINRQWNDGQIFDDEHDEQMDNVSEKYGAQIKEAQERLLLASIVEAERAIREGRRPDWDPEQMKKELEAVRSGED